VAARRLSAASLLSGTALALLLPVAAGQAAPDGWTLTAAISEKLSLNSNATLAGSGGSSLRPVSSTQISVNLTKSSGSSSLSLTGGVSPLVTRNTASDVLGLLSPRIGLSLSLPGKRTSLTAGLNAAITSIEFADLVFGLDANGNPDPLNSQLLTANAVQASLGGTLGLSWSATPRDTLGANLSLRRVDFTESTTGLTPSSRITLGGFWSRTLTPRTDGRLSASLGWFVAENALDTRTLSLDLSGGFSHVVSPRLSLSGSLGVSLSRDEQRPAPGLASDTDFAAGLIGDFGITYATPEISFRLSLSQGLQPTLQGALQNTSALNASASWTINASSSLGLSAQYQLQSPLGSVPGTNATNALRLSPTYSWKIDQTTSLQLGYTYTLSDQSGQITDSHAVFLSLSRSFNLLN
jgi:hypothetical protein